MTTIYIASPYTHGNQAENVRKSLEEAENLRQAGFLPFCPLLSHFWHFMSPHPYDYWMKMDLEWLEKCDGLLRLPGESAGADAEVEHALAHNIPVFFNMVDLVEWFGVHEWTSCKENDKDCPFCQKSLIDSSGWHK